MKLSIGAGARRIPGWVHLDIDPALQPDIVADITQPLPLPDASVSYILCEEVVTQISIEACIGFLRECRRVLRPGGVVRVLMPDLHRFVTAYLEQPDWLVRIWNQHVGIPLRYDTAAEVLNYGLRGVGLFVYDRQTFDRMAADGGFDVVNVEFNQSVHEPLRGLDMRGPGETLTTYLELLPSAPDQA